MKTMVHAFVTTRVDFCNTVFASAPRSVTDKLQRVMNAAARLVSGTRKYDRGCHSFYTSTRDLGQGAIRRPRQRCDEIWCIERQKLHGVTSSASWSIVSEEVSCYGTNRRQKVLTEQDVTVISAINFYRAAWNADAVL